MLMYVLFASCMSVGGCIAVKAYSVSCVNLSQSAFLQLVYDRLFCCIVCWLSVCIVSNIGRLSEFNNNVYLKSNIQTSSMDCTYKLINTKVNTMSMCKQNKNKDIIRYTYYKLM